VRGHACWRVAPALLAVPLCVISSACATTHYTQSELLAAPLRIEDGAGSIASLAIERVKLRIEPLDRAPAGQAIPPLALRIVFDPPALGYSFDPGQVVLRGADGKEWRGNASGYRPLYPKASVEFGFDAAVEPDAPFELVLGGLARGEKRLEPVTLRLARRKGLLYDRLYWLEAIGFLLTYPSGGM
jgi:hypothetical protein